MRAGRGRRLSAAASDRTRPVQKVFRFGDFVLDTGLFELRQGDERIEIQPKALELLAYLLANPTRALPKEELLATLWPDVAVTADALFQVVRVARRALGKAGDGVIVTVRGRGYRIGVPVVAEDVFAGAPQVRSGAPAGGFPRWRSGFLVGIFIGCVGGVVVASAAWVLGAGAQGPPPDMPSVAPRAVAEARLAVLPFADLSLVGELRALADGLTEDLFDELSVVDGIALAPRTSSFAFRSEGRDARRAGSMLGVDYVLEGSVGQDDEHLRVSAELVSTRDGTNLWAGDYEGSHHDVSALEQTIKTSIVDTVRVELEAAAQADPAASAPGRRFPDPEQTDRPPSLPLGSSGGAS